jgi:hypothetical protein
MTYVPEKKYYTTSILLKQGYYDYYYAEKTNKGFDARITEEIALKLPIFIR